VLAAGASAARQGVADERVLARERGRVVLGGGDLAAQRVLVSLPGALQPTSALAPVNRWSL
jgi:hypothetical protein